jgi:AraC-like DNA-binding protein
LHAQACRIAETNLNRIAHPEVVRALEQDLIWALTSCLTAGTPQHRPTIDRHDSQVLVRFEEARTAYPYSLPRIGEICGAIGASERTLQIRCAKLLGMSPLRYLSLRRLSTALAELRRSDTHAAIIEVSKLYGFRDPRHFIADYVGAFGEAPLGFPPDAGDEIRRNSDFAIADGPRGTSR